MSVLVQGRTPLDLLSKGLKGYLTAGTSAEVYSWGNGANYQLGSGAEGLQLVPYRVENLHGENTAAVAAAKFHSAAVSKEGVLFTWGFGRGGRLGESIFHGCMRATVLRLPICSLPCTLGLFCAMLDQRWLKGPEWLEGMEGLQGLQIRECVYSSCMLTLRFLAWAGHPEFHIHSGESAVIFPRAVAIAGRKPIAAVATGKHHTAAITRAGELYTWGSNRDGRLGYPAVDTQPIPRRWGPVCDAQPPAGRAVTPWQQLTWCIFLNLADSSHSCPPQWGSTGVCQLLSEASVVKACL